MRPVSDLPARVLPPAARSRRAPRRAAVLARRVPLVIAALVVLLGALAAPPTHAQGDPNALFDGRFALPGFNGEVEAVASSGIQLVAAGAFDGFSGQGNVLAPGFANVALWNGAAWRPLGRGVNGRVFAAAFWNGGIVVGGTFTQATQADGTALAVGNLAFWTGTAWQAVAGGTSGAVRALAVQGTALVVGGVFTSARATGGADVAGTAFVASTDGTSWTALGAGLGQNGATGRANGVYALAMRGGDVVVGGVFNEAYAAGGSVEARPRNVGVWSGAGQWSALSGIDGSGPAVGVQALAVVGTDASADVYVGGDFFGLYLQDTASTTFLPNKLALWSGATATWSAPTSFFGGSGTRVKALLAEADGAVVIGGDFTSVNGFQRTLGVARLRGTSVEAIDGGIGPRLDPMQTARRVNALARAGAGRVAVGGFFDQGATLAGTAVRSSALLFASGAGAAEWEAAGLGVPDGTVYLVHRTAGGGAIVGGTFASIGGLAAQNIARWDGARFLPMGRGLLGPAASPSSGEVRAVLALANGDLLVGGDFRQAVQTDGSVLAVSNVVRWDGTQWHAFEGFSGTVYTFGAHLGTIYAGGDFSYSRDPSGTNLVQTGALAELGPNGHWRSVFRGYVTGSVYAIAGGYVGGQGMALKETFHPCGPTAETAITQAESIFRLRGPIPENSTFVCTGPYTGQPKRRGLFFEGTTGWAGGTVYALEPTPTGVLVGAAVGLGFVQSSTQQSLTRIRYVDRGYLGTANAVRAVERIGGRTTIGGDFSAIGVDAYGAGGVAALGLAMRDGSGAWTTLGSGISLGPPYNQGTVHALGATGTDLFIGGKFAVAGGAPAGNIARWASGPNLADSDGDGVSDADEKMFADGTDANLAGPFPDSDTDGTPDYLDLDSDNDGVPDNVESGRFDAARPPVDTDADGIPDLRDADSDGDGLSDAAEQGAGPALDDDSDGLPNRLDLDSDGDGIADGDEGTGDANGNGLPDYRDAATARRAVMALSGQTGPLSLDASGVLLDLGSNTASATFEAVRFEVPPAGTLPAGQANALGRYWRLAYAGGGTFSTSACFALSGLPVGANASALRIYKRETSADAWALLPVRLRTDVTPNLLCADNQTQFSEFVVTADPAELPVELVVLTAQSDGVGAVVVRWETASETNNAGFFVETQAAGAPSAAVWTEHAFAPGRGTTSERTAYTRRLDGLAPGAYRVRLRQVDLDGAATLSASVEVVLVPAAFAIGAPRPSPTRGMASVSVRLPAEAEVSVRLFDALGRETGVAFRGTLPAGETAVALDASALAPGLYIVRATSGGRTESQRLVVAGR